jgi:competence protein ComEC
MARPPGVVVIAVGYGAGLATGLARFPDLTFVVMGLLAITLLLRREWWVPVLPAVAVGIGMGGHARSAAHEWCAARLPLGDRRLAIRAVDPGEGLGRVALVRDRCSGAVLARWPRGTQLSAGLTMLVKARWMPAPRLFSQPDGTLLIGSIDSTWGSPGAVERARTAMIRSSRILFGPRAPLVDALLGGWRGEIDPDLRRAFASTGLVHVLAISGLHIACLAGWVLLILRLCRVRRHPAEFIAAAAAIGYLAFLGWPAAAARAVALLLLVAFSRWRQRQVRAGALAGGSALMVLLLDPWAITNVGAWLSILAISGLVAASRWSDRAIGTAWWARDLSGSIGALLATAPLSAGAFGQVAPIGIVLNIIALPLSALILPAVSSAILLLPTWPALGHALATSGNGLLALLEFTVRAGARAPGAAAPGPGGIAAALPWIAVLLATSWIIHGPTTLREALRRTAWMATAGAWIALFAAPRRVLIDDHRLSLLFLDVGQGDAALLRTPLGHWIAVDAGPIGDGRDAGQRVVAPMLARQGAQRVDVFVLSHAHRDHVGGGASVLQRLPTTLAIEPGELFADSAYDAWLGALAARHTRWRAARAGTTWTLDGVRFRVLHPPLRWARQGEDLNEDSIVLEVAYGGFRALFMGDAGFVAESALVGALHPVNVLKVGHHGSRTASSVAFLAAVQPQAAIVSVGRNNYGHPSSEALQRLADAKVMVLRTDREGTVRVSTDGNTFTVTGARAAATFPVTH